MPPQTRTNRGSYRASRTSDRDGTLTKAGLSKIIRDVGAEIVDPELGLTRIQAVVRSLYADAVAGKTAAAEILLERGWGKVATPVRIDVKGEVTGILSEAGISIAEASADPVMRALLTDGGIIEGEFESAPITKKIENESESPE